ncbi:MAG: glycosyltransferase, partial [Planctomycetota bacterium]
WRCVRAPYPRQDGWRERGQSAAQFLRSALLADAIRREPGAALLHAQFADGAATTAMLAAEALGRPFSFFSHTSYNPQRLADKLRRAAAVFSISDFDRARLLDIAPDAADRIAIIRCGLPLEDWPWRAGAVAPTVDVLSVGSLIPKKGHGTLLAALGQIHADHPGLRARIVGDGPLRTALTAERDRLGLADAVAFDGALPEETVREILPAARVFALACTEAPNGDIDGIPVALMEAMATGVPVVSTALSGIPELIEDGVTGRLVPPDDPAALAAAIRETLDNPAAATRARAARARIETDFAIAREAARLAGRLRALLPPAGAAAGRARSESD